MPVAEKTREPASRIPEKRFSNAKPERKPGKKEKK
jgi:hypothetical protein